MELQATSFDVEELLNVYHLRALLHSVIASAGQRWLAGGTD